MRFWLVLLLGLSLAAGILFVVQPWGGGTELVFTLSLPAEFTGTPKSATEETARVLLDRARILDVEATVKTLPDGRIRLRLLDVKPDDLEPYRAVFEKKGRLELLASAAPEVQAKFDRDGQVPPGFRRSGPVLLVDRPVVTSADVSATLIGDVGPWSVAVELDYKPQERYDQVRRDLFVQKPQGDIVVMMDGVATSTPAGGSGVFAGRIEILSGKTEIETRCWAAIVGGGELPYAVRPPQVGIFRGRP